MSDLVKSTDEELWRVLWEAGDLTLLMHKGQKEIHDAFHTSDGLKYVLCCSRRYGKSMLMCIEAIMLAIQKPGAMVTYGSGTQKMVKEIVVPHMTHLLQTCPADLRPKHNIVDGKWFFPNGSVVKVAGCQDKGDKLRGTGADLILLDEVGYVDHLDYVVGSVLQPQLMTTGGRMFMASTPSETPAHPFEGYARDTALEGAYAHRTIYDAPHIKPWQVELYKRVSGGERSTTWRREYLAEFVVDGNRAVVPEFTECEEALVTEFEAPDILWDKYVSLDVGYTDLTVALFAQYVFPDNMLYVLDEVVLQRSTSAEIDQAVRAKEQELWGDSRVYRRTADAPQIVLADLSSKGRPYGLPNKYDKEAGINQLRMATQNLKYRIHPRCKNLAAHMRGAIWNTTRKTFERSGECGHFDAVDAMAYLLRSINRQHNPYVPEAKGEDELLTRAAKREIKRRQDAKYALPGVRRKK